MTRNLGKILLTAFILLFTLPALADDAPNNPCDGLLSLVNRPTIGDSACTVPLGHAILEEGFQYLNLLDGGNSQIYPQAQIRVGLPGTNEITAILPNHVEVPSERLSGTSAGVLGFKHNFGYTEHWTAALEGLITFPGGSPEFGSAKTGTAVNGILTYTLGPIAVSGMLGELSQTEPAAEGGRRFDSINQILVLSYQPKEWYQFYVEIFGVSKTGPGEGSGYNLDTGFLFLLAKNFEIDFEIGKRLGGHLGGFSTYYGTGFSLLF